MAKQHLTRQSVLACVAFCLVGHSVASSDCSKFPPKVNRAIAAFTAKVRGVEDCNYRHAASGDLDQDGQPDLIVGYTVEGACPNNSQGAPGTCGNHYETYLMAFTGKDQVPSTPLQIGGKGILDLESVTIGNGNIQVNGLKFAKTDPSCCPSVKTRQLYRLEGRALVAASVVGQQAAKPVTANHPSSKEGNLVVEGTPVTYKAVPELKPNTVAFQMDSKGYRNTYHLDCLEKKYLWVKNIDLRTNQETGNNAGAEWKLMSEKSTVTNAVYDAICPQLLGSNSAVTPTDCIRTESYLPSGWCQPGPSDFKDAWLAYKAEEPEPYHITGWFDDNSTKDHAWILYRQDRSAWGVFVFLLKGQAYTTIKLSEANSNEGGGMQGFQLLKADTGEVETACGKGYWDCEADEPAKIILKTNGIIQAPYDRGGSVLSYYQNGKFIQAVLDD